MSTVDQYQAFVTSAELGSLAKAARHLNCSPSAVSKQITALETRLGISVLCRSNRSLCLTSEGEALFEHAKRILADIDRAEAEAKSVSNAGSGRIGLSLSPALIHSPVLSALRDFCQQYPGIRFDLKFSNDRDDLNNSRVDFAFRIGKLADNRLRAMPLCELRPVFCASPRFAQRAGLPSDVKTLSTHPTVLLSSLNLASESARLFGTADRDLDQRLSHYHLVDDISAQLEMVRKGMCIGAFLDNAVAEDLKAGRLINVFPQKKFPAKKLHLVYVKRPSLPKRFNAFKAFIKAFFSN